MNTAQQAGQSARDLAQKIARQMVQEPLEVLKTAEEQVTGPETPPQNESQNSGSAPKSENSQQKLQDNMRSTRRMEALNQELKDIHKQDLFADLQEKISLGEDVPIPDYTELSMEQRQVLIAQKEAMKAQESRISDQESGVIMSHSKRGRRFGQGQKAEAEKQQTRVEKPVPPSG